MKKIILLIICILGFSQVHAQKTFIPGFRAGANFSNISGLGGDYKPAFYLGFQGAVNFSSMYALQPEVYYSGQGSKNVPGNVIHYVNDEYILKKDNLPIDYVGINVINKFKFANFNFHLGPGLEVVVNSKKYVNNEIDLTFNFGLGYDITKCLGVEVRFKKGLTDSVYNYNGSYEYRNFMNNVFQIGLYYQFYPSKEDN